jgi:predicted AAA+ superfamily ATPase
METVIPRCFRAPEAGFFLFGPRGTGKSTWLGRTFPDALRLDLLDPELARRLAARPERLRDMVLGEARPVVVVDEVQKVPELLDVVHSLVEAEPGRTFVLTGSSARKLRRAGVDLLAGRLVLRSMHPFMACELGSAFDLEQALRVGLVPLVWSAPNPQDVARSYAALYLNEEVRSEGLVRRVGDFARFLEAISFSQAAVLNVSDVARDCEVQRRTAAGYVEILEDLLLAFRLPSFTRRARRASKGHPKFYYFDVGVFRSLRPAGPLDRPEEIEGAALESLVAQHLRAFVDYRQEDSRLYYWRNRGGLEVDFVVYGADRFWGLEVKRSARVRPADLRGLRSFGNEYPEARRLLLYQGNERLERDGVLCLPVEQFLQELDPHSPPGW